MTKVIIKAIESDFLNLTRFFFLVNRMFKNSGNASLELYLLFDIPLISGPGKLNDSRISVELEKSPKTF